MTDLKPPWNYIAAIVADHKFDGNGNPTELTSALITALLLRVRDAAGGREVRRTWIDHTESGRPTLTIEFDDGLSKGFPFPITVSIRERRPSRAATGVSAVAARMLPADVRDRYRAEFFVELFDLNAEDADRRAQIRYAVNQLTRVARTNAALHRPRGSWKFSLSVGVGGSGVVASLGGWYLVTEVAVLALAATGGAMFVVSSASRMDQVVKFVRTILDRKGRNGNQ